MRMSRRKLHLDTCLDLFMQSFVACDMASFTGCGGCPTTLRWTSLHLKASTWSLPLPYASALCTLQKRQDKAEAYAHFRNGKIERRHQTWKGMCRAMLNRGSTQWPHMQRENPTTKLLLSVRVLMMNVVYLQILTLFLKEPRRPQSLLLLDLCIRKTISEEIKEPRGGPQPWSMSPTTPSPLHKLARTPMKVCCVISSRWTLSQNHPSKHTHTHTQRFS